MYKISSKKFNLKFYVGIPSLLELSLYFLLKFLTYKLYQILIKL